MKESKVNTLKAIFKAIAPKANIPTDKAIIQFYKMVKQNKRKNKIILVFPVLPHRWNNTRVCLLNDIYELSIFQCFALQVFDSFDDDKCLFRLMEVEKIIKTKVSFELLNHKDILKKLDVERKVKWSNEKKQMDLF